LSSITWHTVYWAWRIGKKKKETERRGGAAFTTKAAPRNGNNHVNNVTRIYNSN